MPSSLSTSTSRVACCHDRLGGGRPMPLASALELVLGHYDIYDVDSLVAILRSPHDASQVANLIDGSRALIDATAGTAHVNVQTECATVTVGTTMESVISVREVGSMATFSPTSGARMVSMQVQCSPQPPQMVDADGGACGASQSSSGA